MCKTHDLHPLFVKGMRIEYSYSTHYSESLMRNGAIVNTFFAEVVIFLGAMNSLWH